MTKNIKIIAGAIIGVAVTLAITSAWNDSIIVDEVPHIGAGYSYLAKHDMRLNPEHPPLAKDVAAIPLLFLNLKQDVFQTKFWQTDINGQWEFGRNLIFGSGNDADLIRHAAKVPMILFFVLACILVFKWASKLYGEKGALIALFLFAFSPTVLAHARFVTTDVPALFGTILASYFFVNYLKKPGQKNFWIASIAFGIALITKFSTFLLVPYLGLLAVVYGLIKGDCKSSSMIWSGIKMGLISVLIFITGFIIIVWPVYYFHTYNYPPERQYSDTQYLLGSFGKRYLVDPVIWASDKPILRAAAQYGLGFFMVVQRSTGGNTTYFLGEVSRTGWHKYFPIVYFLKEPLPWWILTAIAIILSFWGLQRSQFKSFGNIISNFIKNNFDQFAMILWLIIYWGTSINSNLNIGVRHLLPTYPFAIILISGPLVRAFKNSKIFAYIITFMLSWYLYENVMVYPYYLTYFNQIAGGPSGGYRYVVDSNVDWGQDLLRLNQWVDQNHIAKMEIDYFGWADPVYYLKDHYIWLSSKKYKDAQDFIKNNQSNGWLAVSVTFLQGSQGTPDNPNEINYDKWLKSYTPVTVIGNSIFIYHIQ